MRIKIVALGGSLSQQSTSLAAVRVALEGASQAGVETELLDVRQLGLPMYAPNAATVPDSAIKLCESVYACQGMLWSSPLYHGTISGSFKNALDWLQLLGDRNPPYLTDKVIGLISTAGGTQGLQAVNTMEFIVRALRGWAVPLVVPVPQAWRIIQQGHVLDDSVAAQLRALGAEVARAAGHFAAGQITSAEAERAEATLQPLSDSEVRKAKLS
jgi:FMN reductase